MKLCMGCMNQIEDYITECPHCGFNETTLRQESYYLDPGTIVGGKYIVGRVLSYGGHTVTYLGFDAEKNRKVMVKEYLPSDFSTRSDGETEVTIYSGDAMEQFEQGLTNYLNEASRIQQLGHVDGIADIYDCLAENETGYVISEYVEGRTLKQLLDAGQKYNVSSTITFIKKILSGLKHVHPLDVIHCDIAPETIMVTNDGDIKLMDFGATRYVTTANSKSLAIILKQGYAPEEQYRSKGVRGPWTDVYAVAAVMYRMLTGQVPQESVERALVDELQDPSKLGVQLPPHVENALMNALNVYQEDRTKSAADFLKELNNKETKRTKVKRTKKAVTKFPLWAKGLVACFVLVIAIGGFVIFKSASQDTTIEVKNCKVPDFKEKTIEDAQNIAKEWNENEEIDNITIEQSGTRFTLDSSLNGTICEQDVPADTDLRDPKQVNGLNNDNLTYGDGKKLTGTIKCVVYSSTDITYSELAGKNAFEISKVLNQDINNKELYARETKWDEKGDEPAYWTVINIQLQDGSNISKEEIENESNKEKAISYEQIKQVSYFGKSFFKWDKLPDFKAKYETEGKLMKAEFDRYQYKNEKEIEKTGKKGKLSPSMLQKDYCSFDYPVGTIVGQNVEPGEKYDASDANRKKDLKIKVVGIGLGIRTEKGNDDGYNVRSWLRKEAGLDMSQIHFRGSRGGSNPDANESVTNYYLQNKDGKPILYFEKGDKEVQIYLTIYEKPKSQPKPSSGGSKNNSGGGSKNNSGGGSKNNSGGGSGRGLTK